jgi:hypothetical protein
MAKPALPNVGTRIYPSQRPVPTSFIQQPSGQRLYNPLPSPNAPPDVAAAGGVTAGLVLSVGGAAPDYLTMTFAVFGIDGSTTIKTGVLNVASWVSAGSDPTKSRWDYVDLTA